MRLSFKTLLVSFPSFCLLFNVHFLCISLSAASVIRTNNETDRLALLEFKAKIANDPLKVMASWNSSLHFCQWYGIKCGRRHQRVIVLDLSSVKLSGPISPNIGNLSFLKVFILRNNSFTHEIPPQIGHLHRLQILNLASNALDGEIPSNISSCSNLLSISLVVNNLIGTIPASLGNLSSLQNLSLRINNFNGVIPDTLGQLKNLSILDLYENRFSGTIPPSIFNLSLLSKINVGSNNLQGNLPLDLGNTLPNLQYFSIISNQFTGIIPPSISNASTLETFQLTYNNLTGGVPSLEKLSRLSLLNFAFNNLGNGKADDLKFLSTLSNATFLEILVINHNNFGGKLPENISNFSKKLEHFGIENNKIFGNIPAGLEFLDSLNAFFARMNHLTGTIPHSIGKLRNLRSLSLGNNNFLGYIPSSLGNLTNLIELDLSSNDLQSLIPPELGNCKNLILLVLFENNLSGPIPPQILQLSSLSIALDLAENHLSGFLPNEVKNLKNVGYLGLSDNKLSGEIPSGLSSCTSLEFLYMGANLFQGSIPSSLSSLRGLQELNLSHNMLSGKIPEFLEGFNSLELLDLSYNDFEGMVPIEGVFKNATATSMAGNKNLCGGIPDFMLPPCKLEQSKKGLTLKLKIIVSTFSLLIGVAFLLICVFLCHSRTRKEISTSASPAYGDSLLKLSYQNLLKATNGFSLDNLIGTGSFGSVYKGILDEEGIVIAVKVLNLERRGASKSFLAECEALRNIRHRNLVQVLTACSGVDYHGNDFKALVYNFMVNGSLDGWLHQTHGLEEPQRTLSVLRRLNIAIDVACALEYLHHHCGIPIIHCDLKPSNVLLNEEMTGHVSDFGLMKFLSDGTIIDHSTDQFSSIGIRGSIGYCPPEYGVGSEVSKAGDIFSFGVLLLEMFTGKRPTDDIFKEGLSLHNFVKRALPEHVTQVIDSNLLQMQINDDSTLNHNKDFGSRRKNTLTECLISIFEIGISCSIESPQDRMGIGDVVAQLSC